MNGTANMHMERGVRTEAPCVTVFTPTYNRRHTLWRVYRSLLAQTFRDFEWLIVDDGSTDDTGSLVGAWLREKNSFTIRYYRKQNGGKHTAHNLAITLARGEYFAILDSDDWYDPDALRVLVSRWDAMGEGERRTFANIEGVCRYEDGRLIGALFPQDVYDSDNFAIQALQERPMDTMGMYRLAVLREFPFPDGFDGCFVIESLVWDRIADRYRTRFINTTVGYKEYLAEGLTRRPLKARLANSASWILYYRELAARNVPLRKRFKCRVNVYRYALHNRLPLADQLGQERSPVCALPFALFGVLLCLKDRMVIRREEAAAAGGRQ